MGMLFGDTGAIPDEVYDDCELTNKVLKEWIDSATMEEREAFTKEFFASLEVKGSETMIEFKKNGIAGVWNVVYSAMKFSPGARKAFAKLMKSASKNVVTAVPGKIGTTVTWLAGKAFERMVAMAPPEGSFGDLAGAEYHIARDEEE